MGDRFAGLGARQHPDLTGPIVRPRSVLGAAILALLALDGVLSAIFATLLLPSHIGSYPFPLSALISGAVNAALVWAGLQCTTSLRLAAVSVWTWLLTVLGVALMSPGMFDGPGFDRYSLIVLMILGVIPPAVVLRRARRRQPADAKPADR